MAVLSWHPVRDVALRTDDGYSRNGYEIDKQSPEYAAPSAAADR
jgi:hypothetical protein